MVSIKKWSSGIKILAKYMNLSFVDGSLNRPYSF
jgi:hypothetical protein